MRNHPQAHIPSDLPGIGKNSAVADEQYPNQYSSLSKPSYNASTQQAASI